MKRFFLLAATLFVLGVTQADAWMYNTVCGTAVQTVSPDCFETEKDRKEFYADLDMIYCGYTDKEEEDQPENPDQP